jgi:hypothetical protein
MPPRGDAGTGSLCHLVPPSSSSRPVPMIVFELLADR